LIGSMHVDSVSAHYRDLVVPAPRPQVLLGWQRVLLENPPQQMKDWLRRIRAPCLAVFSREPWLGHEDWLRRRTDDGRAEVYDGDGHR
jgi:hypothetical protein